MTNKIYFPGLDLLKWILAVRTIAVHSSLFSEWSSFHDNFFKIFGFGVPTFLAVSAFLFVRKLDDLEESKKRGYIMYREKRLLIFYVIWWLIMLPMTFDVFFSIATTKEVVFAALLKSTFNGYWFIKALIINTFILYLFRMRKSMIIITILSILIYLYCAFAYEHLFESPIVKYSPYYSFYYHLAFFAIGGLLARYGKKSFLFTVPVKKLVLLLILLLPISLVPYCGSIVRLLYPVILIPIFARITINNKVLCKKLRVMSILYYTTHFMIIWLYGICVTNFISEESSLYPLLSFSSICFISTWLFATLFSLLIIRLEKKYPILNYLH